MTVARPILVLVHRWIGLLFAALLVVQGVTGAAMSFRAELNRTLHASAMSVIPSGPALPVQELLEHVRAAHPDQTVSRIEFPLATDEAFLFRLDPEADEYRRIVTVDPYRGTITRDATVDRWPVEWLFDLHHTLLLGEAGELMVGFIGAALLFLVVTGPFVWWPGRRRLRQGFSVTMKGGSYRGVRDLHRVGGILLASVLAVSALTGMFLVWKVPLQPVLAKIVPTISKPSVKVAERADVPLLPIDMILASARARYGEAAIRNVRFPGGTGRIVNIFFDVPESAKPRASNQIWLDGYTAEPIGFYEAAALPPGNSFLDWMLPVHSGEFLGLGGRLLFLIGAVALPGFAITGLWMWLKRRRLSRKSPASLRPTNTLPVRIARAWNETATVRGLELKALDGEALPAFTAGAHVDLVLADGLVRQYSVWSDPSDRFRYCIAVLREARSRGGSAAAHTLEMGETILIGVPRNSFPLDETAPMSLLIAGGIGITPLVAMATRLHAIGRRFRVHYCARSAEAAPLRKVIAESDWGDGLVPHFGDDSNGTRFDSRSVLEAADRRAHIYVCGPARLIDDVMTTARILGWPENRLHAELFTPAAAPDPDARPFDIVLARTGITLHVPPDRTAIEVLADHGVGVPTSCRLGLCGSCTTTVLEGNPDHHDRFLTPEERAGRGLFTPCCSRSLTPTLVLDL